MNKSIENMPDKVNTANTTASMEGRLAELKLLVAGDDRLRDKHLEQISELEGLLLKQRLIDADLAAYPGDSHQAHRDRIRNQLADIKSGFKRAA